MNKSFRNIFETCGRRILCLMINFEHYFYKLPNRDTFFLRAVQQILVNSFL